jgi:microcystin-dependent protein
VSESFIGQISIFGFNFPPRGWASCDGQVLSIAQNTALFSLLGTTYGGNGQTTFALPNLQGRVPIHRGQGPGLSNHDMGEVAGAEAVTLTSAQMPAHSHQAAVTNASAAGSRPNGNFPSAGGAYAAASDGSTFNAGFVKNSGGGQPAPSMPPYLALNFCICVQGIFPSRN